MPKCPRCAGCLQVDVETLNDYGQPPELLCRTCGRRFQQRTPPPVFETPAADLLPCYMRVCRLCGKAFKRHRPDRTMYCGPVCRLEASRTISRLYARRVYQPRVKLLARMIDCRNCGQPCQTAGNRGLYCGALCKMRHWRRKVAAQVGQSRLVDVS